MIWAVLVASTVTMLGPLPLRTDTGRDRAFGDFTQSMRDMVLTWAIALDVAGLAPLPVASVWLVRR